MNLTEKSVIKVNATIDEVAKITRQGNSAVIYFKNGETITIENYFDYAVNDNRIVFEHEGQLYWAEFTDENGVMLDTIRYHPLTGDLAESGTVAAGVLPWLGGALALGAIAAAAGGGSSSGSSSDNRDMSPPKLTGVIVNEEGQLELSFDENINGSKPRAEDFTVVVDGEEIPVTDIVYDGNEIILVTDPVITEDQEVQVTYADSTPGDGQGIRDASGNVLDGFDAIEVGSIDNNSEQPAEDTVAPVLIDAEVNADGNIELSFNETLDADNLPPLDSLVATFGTAPDQTTGDVINIAADGNILTIITNPVITAGQTVSVGYTDPTTGNDDNAIQDLAGNDAASFTTADLPNGVVNNSERLLNLADDNVSAILEGPQDATVLVTYSDSSGIDVLNGTSEVAVVGFTYH